MSELLPKALHAEMLADTDRAKFSDKLISHVGISGHESLAVASTISSHCNAVQSATEGAVTVKPVQCY